MQFYRKIRHLNGMTEVHDYFDVKIKPVKPVRSKIRESSFILENLSGAQLNSCFKMSQYISPKLHRMQ